MIIYDLRCANDHKFEGWFKDRAAFEQQRDQKLVTCPVCGNTDTRIVPHSVNVVGRERETVGEKRPSAISPLEYLRLLHEFIDKHFENVGDRFADVAIKIHYGEDERRNIRGTTTPEDEETLREEGIPFVKIPFPKFDA
ncbi:MAG: DUF1178 family protein [Syntrophales bacterium]|nr:DUF1178 family protein [Syntrophales bacterium]